jgi:hypothetical protein
MADINISKYTTQVIRVGSTPSSPGFAVDEGQDPVDPSGNPQTHLPVTIAAAANALSITESQVLSGAGTVAQYVRGDGSLADFPESSGGGSSVSYYLNGSVSQGTIGGVAYLEMNKVPILGAGTDFTRNSNGYIASFITDAGDPNLLEIPAGNWNFESYFSASSGGGSPTFYVELYKVNSGGTATLIASNSANPELISFGTTIAPYFSSLAVPTTVLALTDRLAVRYYVTPSGRTLTLHTEGPHLCQIITTFTTGLTALNGLTAQVQFFAVGTSGTDFNIASATATHTFNLPTASGTNRGALSSSDWTTFNNKENAITAGTTAQYYRGDKTFQTLNTSVVPELTNLYYTEARVSANTDVAANTAARHNAVTLGTANGLSLNVQQLSLQLASGSQNGALSSTDWTTFNSKENAITAGTTAQYFRGDKTFQTLNTAAVPELTNLYYTEARVSANTDVAANTAARHAAVTLGTANGLSLNTQQLSLGLASAGVTGALSGTDWSTFNSKQNALNGTGFVKISGTTISYDNSTYLTTAAAASTYVPYTGATSGVDLGTYTLSASNLIANGGFNAGALLLKQSSNAQTIFLGYTAITPVGNNTLNFGFSTGSGVWKSFTLSSFLLTDNINRTYTLPDASGTIALVGGTGVGTVTSVAALTLGTSGTDLSSTVANSTTTPVITLNVPTASATNRGALSAADWSTFNNKENAITAGTTAQYYRGDKTFQTLNTAAVPELTNLYYTEARVSANTDVAANTASRHNAVTLGTANGLSLSTQQLSLGLASSSANGALSSTDWTTFNNKQNALTNPVTGTGTTNYLPKFTGASTIGNSLVFDNGSSVGINTTTPSLQGFNNELTISSGTSGTRRTAINIQGSRTTASTFASIGFYHQANFVASIESSRGGADNSGNLQFFTTNAGVTGERMTIDPSGNLGLGVTPSAWGSLFNNSLVQVKTTSMLGYDNNLYLGVNYYATNSSDNYIQNGFASRYVQRIGQHQWETAASGTAGNAISFTQAMTLGTNSGLSIGTPSAAPSQGLLVQGSVGIGASPSFKLDVNSLGYGIQHYGNGSNYLRTYAGSSYQVIESNGTNQFGYFNGNFFVQTSATDRLTIASTGAATFSAATSAITLTANGAANQWTARLLASSTTSQSYGLTVQAGTNSTDIGFQVIPVSGSGSLLYVRGDGNVGIGTTSPVKTLEVRGTFAISNSSSSYWYMDRDDSDGRFKIVDDSNNDRFNITTGGNVLIGTTSDAGFKLDVNGTGRFSGTISGGGNIELVNAGGPYALIGEGTGVNQYGVIDWDATNNRLRIATQPYAFGANGGQITLTTAGNVGIGTTSPSTTLDISVAEASLRLTSTTGTNFTNQRIVNTGGTLWSGIERSTGGVLGITGAYEAFLLYGADNPMYIGTGNSFLRFGTNSTERMRITAGGNVGIGRNNPSQRLDILGSGTVYANIENSDANIAAVITKNTSKTFTTGLVTDYWAVIDATSGSNTRLMIESGGNVLINTTTNVTGANLNVNGNIRTAAPTGGSAENWKLGNAVNGTVNANRLIRIEIAGVGYDLVARQII